MNGVNAGSVALIRTPSPCPARCRVLGDPNAAVIRPAPALHVSFAGSAVIEAGTRAPPATGTIDKTACIPLRWDTR